MINLEKVFKEELDKRLSHLVGGKIEDVYVEYNSIVNGFVEEIVVLVEKLKGLAASGYRYKQGFDIEVNYKDEKDVK